MEYDYEKMWNKLAEEINRAYEHWNLFLSTRQWFIDKNIPTEDSMTPAKLRDIEVMIASYKFFFELMQTIKKLENPPEHMTYEEIDNYRAVFTFLNALEKSDHVPMLNGISSIESNFSLDNNTATKLFYYWIEYHDELQDIEE